VLGLQKPTNDCPVVGIARFNRYAIKAALVRRSETLEKVWGRRIVSIDEDDDLRRGDPNPGVSSRGGTAVALVFNDHNGRMILPSQESRSGAVR
jgi:hypothetical protein